MSFEDNSDPNIQSVALTSENTLMTVVQPEMQTQTPQVAPNSVFITKPSSVLIWGASAPTTKTLDFFNTDFYPEYAKAYIDKWQYNFNNVLGPLNPAFANATLSWRDIAYGLHLEYNPNGILWRVNAAGIPIYEDMQNYFEQNRVIQTATERTNTEVGIRSPEANQAVDPSNEVVLAANTQNVGQAIPQVSANSSTQIVPDGVRNNDQIARDLGIAGITNSGKLATSGDFGERIIQVARQQLGIPYDLGGDGISTTDCGKYTLDTYRKIGIDLDTRLADEQYDYCKNKGSVFTDFSQAQPGDLVFFQNTYGNWEPGTITHVGIYIGDGKMINASSSKGVSYADIASGYWQDHFSSFGRIR